MKIPTKIAGLLCAAIISDTLMFRSPTCTPVDEMAARALADIAGIDIEKYAMEMFSAGSNLKDKSDEEIFYQDFKRFTSGKVTIGVGQITSLNGGELDKLKGRMEAFMEKALENNAKPVSALMSLLCMAMREYLGKEKIQYSYSSDTRDVAGVPNALYNCVCSFGHTVQLQAQTRLADFVADVDADIRRDLQPESKRHRMADQMGWVYKVNQQKAPLRIKQRVFQMGEYIGGTISDFWLSYLGNPLMPATPELAQYTTDFGVWVPPDGASVGVEAASLNGKIILCIHNKAPNPGLADILRKTFENEGVAVLEAEDLD